MKRLLFLFCCLTITGAAQDFSLQELVNRKQFTEVINRVDSLTAADSTDYATMSAIAQAYEGLLRYPQAYNYYQHCLMMDTTNVDMLNASARMAANIGKAGDARQYFRKVLEKDSTNFYANYQLARLYQQQGEYTEAIEKYKYLMHNDPENPVLLRNIGDCYVRQDALLPAALIYFRAYAVNRENASLASTLINTMLRMGPESAFDALQICDTALYYNPGNKLLLQNKGMTLYMNRKYAEADTLYTQLMMDGDSTALTIKYAGVCRYYAGKFMDSIEPLEMAYEQDPTSPDVCLLLGSALGKTYDRKRAFTLFDEAEQNMKPEPVLTRQLLRFRAETYRKDGNYEKSDKLFYEAWKEEPTNLDLLGFLAQNHSPIHVSVTDDERQRALSLFIRVLYLKESIKANAIKPSFYYHRYYLESLHKDMFFRGVTEEPMIAPDGKKSRITIEELSELIEQLPEIPEDLDKKMNKDVKKINEMRTKPQKTTNNLPEDR